jgi:hypothetical protein
MEESRAEWALRTVSDAFYDLESLAETIETESGASEADVRLAEYPGLNVAFQTLTRLVGPPRES